MLKGNLSTRPFYNERLVSLAFVLVAMVAFFLTVFNAGELISLSRERMALNGRINRDRSEATRISGQANAVQRTVDRSHLQQLVGETHEANTLIDQRTFSWTSFFGLIEKTLPRDARLLNVSPRVDNGEFQIVMQVKVRASGDLTAFAEALAGTGQFYDVVSRETQRNDDDTDTVTLMAGFLPPTGVPAQVKPKPLSSKRGARP
ncbi:MAG: hypothetical protein ACM4AI_25975 [Acidobacteriota bacterium]